MIIGEEYWVEKALREGEDYDHFLKKLRKKIKKIKPLKVINPVTQVKRGMNLLGLGQITGLGGNGGTVEVEEVEEPPQENPAAVAVQEDAVQVAQEREELMKEVADFEEKKAVESIQLAEEKTALEQEKIEVENGETKKMLYIGLIGLGGLVVIGGIVVWLKSRQNQLEALQVEAV